MIRRCLLGAFLSALLIPATALAATSVSGSKSDPKGEAPSTGDLVRASATYKSGGRVKAKITLTSYADAAANETVVGAFFARRGKGGGCNTRAGGIVTSIETDTKVAQSGYAPGPGKTVKTLPATAKVRGNTITLSAADGRFANRRLDCVVVASIVATGPSSSKGLDRISFRLKP